MSRKIRLGMVGGGRGAFIGAIHRIAAALDGQMELVCGAFSSDPVKSRLSGRDLFLNEDRIYDNFEEMISKEASLPSDIKMDVVAIVTPNHLHFSPAKMALDSGFHVICDKPVTRNLEEAQSLNKIVKRSGKIFALTHNYTAYPMVKQARMMINHGELGKIRKVIVMYPQGWLSTRIEKTHQKQAVWRTDPSKSGVTGAMGDIGTHAENLMEYVTGLKMDRICADLHTHVEGRLLDDDGSVLIQFKNGARGVMLASQIAAGEENNLSIQVYGEKGGITWNQMEANSLSVRWLDKPMEILRTGTKNLYKETLAHTRLPAGHPEGYLEAFANIYRDVAYCIQARLVGKEADPIYQDFPGIDEGLRGMYFLDAVVRSSKAKEKWISLDSK